MNIVKEAVSRLHEAFPVNGEHVEAYQLLAGMWYVEAYKGSMLAANQVEHGLPSHNLKEFAGGIALTAIAGSKLVFFVDCWQSSRQSRRAESDVIMSRAYSAEK